MGMPQLEKAFELVESHFDKNERFFGDNQDESILLKAENDLALRFPHTYRRFLLEKGYGGVNSLDIDGITDYKFDGSDYGGVVWSTIRCRENSRYPHYIVPIYNLGEGTKFCLDISQMNEEGECPIVAWPVGGAEEGEKLEVIAPDFGTWFLEMVEEEVRFKQEEN